MTHMELIWCIFARTACRSATLTISEARSKLAVISLEPNRSWAMILLASRLVLATCTRSSINLMSCSFPKDGMGNERIVILSRSAASSIFESTSAWAGAVVT